MTADHISQDLFLSEFHEFEFFIKYFSVSKSEGKFNIPTTYPCVEKNIEDKSCSYHNFTNWINNFIVRPNILLGREGPVCPYVSYSLRKQLFFLAVHSEDTFQDAIGEKLLQYRDKFLELKVNPQQDEVFKTLVVLLPNIVEQDIPQFMKTVHARLKTKFVSRGLMLGEFFPGYSQEGLWNPKFYPLSSPIPLFVIRHMVANDYFFLKDNQLFFESYMKFFKGKVPEKLDKLVKGTAHNYQMKGFE